MAYWWVNQNQTFDQEIEGGYLWSPQRNRQGHRNPFYEFMKEVQPGDVVLSFSETRIRAVGVARSFVFPSPKPEEFGQIGENWHPTEGWRVAVRWSVLATQIRPKDHVEHIARFLPERYSPLQQSGDGLQGVYLTRLTDQLFGAIAKLVGRELTVFLESARDTNVSALEITKEEETTESVLNAFEESRIVHDQSLRPTEREALVKARLGQGQFRKNVAAIETRCRVTKVDRAEHLVASHTKPWRKSANEERLNGENGFLLTPTIDHLFDKGFISFENNGELIVSPVAHTESLRKMGIDRGDHLNVGEFSSGQKHFLQYHRDNVFKEAKIVR